ncbi:MAG: hypothetical protein GEU90_13365 [Gemmatimonas sp.]|nr:hypothetical protein [Gemmatimonas sp.]
MFFRETFGIEGRVQNAEKGIEEVERREDEDDGQLHDDLRTALEEGRRGAGAGGSSRTQSEGGENGSGALVAAEGGSISEPTVGAKNATP